MSKIYEDKDFIILSCDSKYKTAYILYNKHKDFKNGHTHINNYKTVRWIMRLYSQRKVPLDLKSTYLLRSLIRISNDEDYTEKIEMLLKVRQNKSRNMYYNVQKGLNKKKYRCY